MTQPTPEQVMFSLKEKAKSLNISFHPNIGEDKLREKINEKLNDQPKEDPVSTGEVPITKELSSSAKLAAKRKAASKLVRVIITSFDPNKKEWQGEFFSVGNAKIGQFKKFIPYGVEWHIPTIMLNLIEDKKMQTFYTVKDGRGKNIRKSKLIKAYGIDYLDPLTSEELAELASIQSKTGRIDSGE